MNSITISKGVEIHADLVRCLIKISDYFLEFPVSIVDATENSFTLGNADIFEIVKRLNKAIESKNCFIDNYVTYPKSDTVLVRVLPRDYKFETPGI